MTEVDVDRLAEDASLLLREGDAGVANKLDSGISMACAVLSLGSRDLQGWPDLVCLLARSLRRRFRWGADLGDLGTAIGILESALAHESRPRQRSSLLAALAVTRMKWIGATDARTGERSDRQLRERAGEVVKSSILAERAAALAEDAPTRRTALHAQGVVANGTPGRGADAIRLIRQAWDLGRDDAEVRHDLARALCDGPTDADRSEGRSELGRMASDWAEGRPRDAFEASRFLGFAQMTEQDWLGASETLSTAVRLRTRARGVAGSEADEGRWVRDTFAIHSEAAFALVQCGSTAAAVNILEAGAALELQQRLGSTLPQEPLSEDEALLYTSITRLGSAAIIVTPQGVTSCRLTFTRSELTTRVGDHLLASLCHSIDPDSAEAARRWMMTLEETIRWLGEAVVEPVLDSIPDSVRLITIVPDGVIGLLPMHAAFALGSRPFAARYSPMSGSVLRSRRSESAQEVLLIDEPTIPWAPALPNASRECDAITRILPASVRMSGSAATLGAVTSKLPHHDIIHIAAHASSRPDNAQYSAVHLADGEELSVARLDTVPPLRARLVVLSACESGLQDPTIPEERIGLPTSFLQAGAAGVVASMWAVSDASTAVLMTKFYVEWADCRDPAVALSAAQAWLRESPAGELTEWLGLHAPDLAQLVPDTSPGSPPYAHPRHWAGFALFGT